MKQLVYFVMVGFSFAALQVATVEAQDNMGVCEPVERIRNMKGPDYELWIERCQVSGSNGQCGNTTEWPAGDGGRCEMTTADTGGFEGNSEAQAPAEAQAAAEAKADADAQVDKIITSDLVSLIIAIDTTFQI